MDNQNPQDNVHSPNKQSTNLDKCYRLIIENESIHILSDSTTCLNKHSNIFTNSKLTLGTKENLNKAGENNMITLYKVRARHIGILGNEKADYQAKLGSGKLPIGPEPFINFTWSTIVNEITEKALSKQTLKITNSNITNRNQTPILHYLKSIKIDQHLETKPT